MLGGCKQLKGRHLTGKGTCSRHVYSYSSALWQYFIIDESGFTSTLIVYFIRNNSSEILLGATLDCKLLWSKDGHKDITVQASLVRNYSECCIVVCQWRHYGGADHTQVTPTRGARPIGMYIGCAGCAWAHPNHPGRQCIIQCTDVCRAIDPNGREAHCGCALSPTTQFE